jgi:UDP-2,3-diacylglucosamine pyrophosphatase LpxH
MNPIIAVLGDLHFSHSGHSHEKFEQQMAFIEQQFFPYLLENNIKIVMQLGDINHDRNRADWYILNEMKKRFYGWFDCNDVQLHALVGNHDTVFKNTLDQNSLSETTKHFENVYVYTKPTVVEIQPYKIGFNPWILDHKNPKLTEKVDILLGHFDVMGFPMLKGIYSKEGLDYKSLSNYRLVMSGHYHIRHIQENFHMVGTPFQLNWNDWNQPRGFVVLDTQFNVTYIQNTVNPQFVKIYYDNGNIEVLGLDYDEEPIPMSREKSLEVVKKNYCRLFTRQVDDQMKLELYHTSLLAVSCDDYKIDIVSLTDAVEDFDSSEFDAKFEEGESTLQLIRACLEGMTFEEGISKDTLLDLVATEYKCAYNEALSIGEE